ncbi:methicillin resistance protein [Companilactobacillus sp. RD055328]|uniref:lipid II:glycine glycyltransferase FemX n=1 Tax=Companilactobacillus sp. RD055328 TaxID=2916634 RepID=UPI001FC84C64|nr:peptidoglycan bridge formation glycyltransferase FemA/FemB family protein [Companilactobacillus sp. RD055328]GKQ42543.1 methicillin resistance protein [Companilactobacillus sp. RD055328]
MPVVNIEDKEELERYENFVKNAPFTSVTQDVAWANVKNNWEPLYVYIEENNEIIAGMSVLMMTNEDGKKFAYCSKGPVCDPSDVDIIDALVQEGLSELKKNNVFLLRFDPEIKFSEELDTKFIEHGYITRNRNMTKAHDTIQPLYNIVVDVKDKNIDEVMANMTGKTRTKIRKSMKSGVEITQSDSLDDISDFFECYKTMSDIHGITYRPIEYFQRMVEVFGGRDMMKIFIARYEGQLQASAIAFNYGDKVWHMYGGSMRVQNSLMIPYYLQHEMIQWATETNKERYDMGGVWGLDNDDGLYRFKHPFAPKQEVVEYIGEIDYVLDQEAYEKFIK